MKSALFHYGYSDFSPCEWAVPGTSSRAVKNIEELILLFAGTIALGGVIGFLISLVIFKKTL